MDFDEEIVIEVIRNCWKRNDKNDNFVGWVGKKRLDSLPQSQSRPVHCSHCSLPSKKQYIKKSRHCTVDWLIKRFPK